MASNNGSSAGSSLPPVFCISFKDQNLNGDGLLIHRQIRYEVWDDGSSQLLIDGSRVPLDAGDPILVDPFELAALIGLQWQCQKVFGLEGLHRVYISNRVGYGQSWCVTAAEFAIRHYPCDLGIVKMIILSGKDGDGQFTDTNYNPHRTTKLIIGLSEQVERSVVSFLNRLDVFDPSLVASSRVTTTV
jgi:hypothetical protein